jgi:hypothetical protein
VIAAADPLTGATDVFSTAGDVRPPAPMACAIFPLGAVLIKQILVRSPASIAFVA